jgi:CRISPR/Cas system CSM-associated protein Csm3 (group 7 of RAMP superfamily)
MGENLHHRIDSLWKLEYKLTVTGESILLYSVGRTDEAKDLCNVAGLREAVAGQLQELPLIFGDTLTGHPVISGNEAKGIFRQFISASLTAKNHKVCVPSTKRHVEETKRRDQENREIREKIYSIPPERIDECSPEKMCFVCTWFGTGSYESQLYYSFLSCDKPFEDVMSNVVPMIAFDEQFGGSASGSLASFVGVKGGTEFNGEITGLNWDEIILGGLYDVAKASESGFVKFGRLRTRGFGDVKLVFTKLEKYSVAPFKLDYSHEGEKLQTFLESCRGKYAEFAKTPSEPKEVNMKIVERKRS